MQNAEACRPRLVLRLPRASSDLTRKRAILPENPIEHIRPSPGAPCPPPPPPITSLLVANRNNILQLQLPWSFSVAFCQCIVSRWAGYTSVYYVMFKAESLETQS
jgi:hypothetical protein